MKKPMKAILLDLDGTVYYGNKLIPGAYESIQYFRNCGLQVLFLTNNSTKTRRQIQEKLVRMGIECNEDKIYTSGYAAALYVRQQGYKSVYIFGADALREEFLKEQIDIRNDAEILVIGYDTSFDYQKLTEALQVALHAKVLIACNKERNYPGEDAKLLPGCGAMVGALEGSVGRKVDHIVGKPNKMMLELICKEHDFNKDDIIVVGDTYDSDIAMSIEYGCRSIYISDKKKENVITAKSIKDIPKLLKKMF